MPECRHDGCPRDALRHCSAHAWPLEMKAEWPKWAHVALEAFAEQPFEDGGVRGSGGNGEDVGSVMCAGP